MGHTYVFARLFVLTLVFQTLEAQLRLVTNGYEDVGIIITDTVKDDPALIDRIMEMCTEVSKLMFRATNQRAYLRNINIGVPKTWALDPSYSPVPAVFPNTAHIRVARKRNATGDTPWTSGNVECGKSGWFFQVTEDFVKTVGPTKYGKRSTVILHEWARLRWGVFGEYDSMMPLSTRPNETIQFYNEGGEWKPVVCSADIEGQARTSCKADKGEICDLRKLKLPANCTFCPNKTQKNIRSSLMAHQWILTMDSFCDEDSNLIPDEYRHNSRAPNQQNRLCNGRSVWEVMREHEDFSGPNNPPADADTDTTPYFNVVQETGRVRVLVFDVSRSMKGERVLMQRRASIMAISTLVEEGSRLGMVQYGRLNGILVPITEIKNRNVRNQLRMRVPTRTGRAGNIKTALELAVKALEDSGIPTHGTEIVLLSGGRSSKPYTSMIPVLKGKGIVVHTMAVGNKADESLTLLSTSTGGRRFSYQVNDAMPLADVYGEAVLTGNIYHDKTETVFSEEFEITGATSGKFLFYLDDGIGKETMVTAYLNTTLIAGLRIVGSNGVQEMKYHPTGMLELQLADPMPGEYTLEIPALGIGRPVQANALVTVTGKPVSEDVDVIRVTSYWSMETLNFSQKGNDVRLYANVEKGGNPVLDANVTAILTGESSTTPVVIQLKDNGISADAFAGDGIYSAYVIRRYINGNGRYSAKIRVSGEGKAFVYKSKMSRFGAPALMPGVEEVFDYEMVPLGNFYRHSLPGSITVENYATTSDMTPPSRVTDLYVADIRYHTDSKGPSIVYNLSWTAVGDDMDVGRAEEYMLRMHEDIDLLRKSFASARGIPTPQPSIAGERENLSVKLYKQDCNGTCYIGLKVKDGGLISELSNIVNADVNFSYKSGEEPEVNESEIESNGTDDNGMGNNGTDDNGMGNNRTDDNEMGNNGTDNNGMGNNGTDDNGVGNNGTDDNEMGNNGTDNNGMSNNGTDDNGMGNSGIDDNGMGNNGTNDNGMGNNGTDDNGMGNNGTDDNGMGNNRTDDNGMGNNGTDNNGMGNNGTDDNGMGNNGTDDNGMGNNGTDYNGMSNNGTDDNGMGSSGIDDNGMGNKGTNDNGMGNNGTDDNGMGNNGTDDNGARDNGTDDNGMGNNGTDDNGMGNNGTDDNGMGNNGTDNNGMGNNGTNNNGMGNNGTDVNGIGSNRTDDNGAGDNGTGNNGTGNGWTGDNGTEDNGTGDSETGNSGTGNNGTGVSGTEDSGTGDSGTGNNGTGDSGTADSGTDNNGTGDNGTEDNGTGDSGTENNGTGTGNNDTGDSGTGNDMMGNHETGNGNNGTVTWNNGTGIGNETGVENGAERAFLSHAMVVMTLLFIVH